MSFHKIQYIVLTSLLLINTDSFANWKTDNGFSSGSWPIVVTASVGPAWTRSNEKQTLVLSPTEENVYIPVDASQASKFISTPKGTHILATGELFIGLFGEINSAVMGQLGFAISTSSQAKVTGFVYQYINNDLSVYNYSYKVANTRVSIKAKALYDLEVYDLFPYLSASVGRSQNSASTFLASDTATPLFKNQTINSLGYTFGVGMEVLLDLNWHLGLGYEFANWGKLRLGRASNQTLNKGLGLSNLRTQELQISVSYLI